MFLGLVSVPPAAVTVTVWLWFALTVRDPVSLLSTPLGVLPEYSPVPLLKIPEAVPLVFQVSEILAAVPDKLEVVSAEAECVCSLYASA